MAQGLSQRDALMEEMMAPGGLPIEQEAQPNDPKTLIDAAIERVMSYVENPAEVTPETVQELLEMLQQASAALGGGDESSLPVGNGVEQVS